MRSDWPCNLIYDVITRGGIEPNDENGHPITITKTDLPENIDHILDGLISRLPEREQDILIKKYKDRMTLKEIGQIYGVTRERVRQLSNKAVFSLYHLGGRSMLRTQ